VDRLHLLPVVDCRDTSKPAASADRVRASVPTADVDVFPAGGRPSKGGDPKEPPIKFVFHLPLAY